MKKSIFMVAVLVISLVACAQNPPKSVADNFNMKFQNATKGKMGPGRRKRMGSRI